MEMRANIIQYCRYCAKIAFSKFGVPAVLLIALGVVGTDPIKRFAVGATSWSAAMSEIWTNLVGLVDNPAVRFMAFFIGLAVLMLAARQVVAADNARELSARERDQAAAELEARQKEAVANAANRSRAETVEFFRAELAEMAELVKYYHQERRVREYEAAIPALKRTIAEYESQLSELEKAPKDVARPPEPPTKILPASIHLALSIQHFSKKYGIAPPAIEFRNPFPHLEPHSRSTGFIFDPAANAPYFAAHRANLRELESYVPIVERGVNAEKDALKRIVEKVNRYG